MDYYRIIGEIPELPLEPPDPILVGYCAACGQEIWRSDLAEETPDGPIHACEECRALYDKYSRVDGMLNHWR